MRRLKRLDNSLRRRRRCLGCGLVKNSYETWTVPGSEYQRGALPAAPEIVESALRITSWLKEHGIIENTNCSDEVIGHDSRRTTRNGNQE
ncbi:hypothetical protein [Planctomicrobium piriforme]|nr:hypothetical protein [Planctomicrobium piriforme]